MASFLRCWIGHRLEPELLLPACHSTCPGYLARLWLHSLSSSLLRDSCGGRGVHTEAEFPSACSFSSTCPLPPQQCLHLGASELQLVALATLHCKPHALPPLPPRSNSVASRLSCPQLQPKRCCFLPTTHTRPRDRAGATDRDALRVQPTNFLGCHRSPDLISPLVHHPRVHPVLVDGLCLTPPPSLSDSYFFTSSQVFIIYSVALPFPHSSTKLADVAFSANIA